MLAEAFLVERRRMAGEERLVASATGWVVGKPCGWHTIHGITVGADDLKGVGHGGLHGHICDN